MTLEEVAAKIDSVDRRLNTSRAVEEAEKSINVTSLFVRMSWHAPTPIPDDALKKLKLIDRASDDRWLKHFLGNARHLGLYRSNVGYYWMLRYEGGMRETYLDHVGSAADVEKRFGQR